MHQRSFYYFRFVALVAIAACCLSSAKSQAAAKSYLIRNVPHVQQKPDFCGEACVASWLQKIGANADQDDVFNASGLDPSLGRGCYTRELLAAVKRIGFQPGPVWNRISVTNKNNEIQAIWTAMLADLADDVPSIICMRTNNGPTATEHFRLVLGYDATADEIIYHEPAAARGAYRRMPRTELIKLWPLKYDEKQWLIIRFALRCDDVPLISKPSDYSPADYAQHIMRLKSRLPNKEFTVLIEHPFVVIGDQEPQQVNRWAEQTIRWATTRLKKQYFRKDPNQILDIWLFKDKASYEANTLRLFGSKPSTPYGYYSSTDGALVMNIATGGGTLVHEIVHPFIEANFAACPAWFNEGLGSLYEQSTSRNERIMGLTNWRLAGLQKAIKRNAVPSFATLCGTTTHQFYRQDPGTNYAQARYLCYYLQEKNLLGKFYHDFVANHKTDPGGYKTLQDTLGVTDMQQFKQEWERYVLGLRFP